MAPKLFCFFFSSFLFALLNGNPSSARTSFNILSYGAKGNGVKDSTQAFLDAWTAACGSNDSALIYIPKGRYLVGAIIFNGVCQNSDITIRMDGTLVAPADYRILAKSSDWLSFEGVNGVSIVGGALDAKGSTLWACKAKGSNCPAGGATSLRFSNSNNIKITGLLSLNSQMFHIAINGCQNVSVEGVRVMAPGDSPNTDGIHIQRSTNVLVTNSVIGTGDDCISIGPGAKNLYFERIRCGPGHGISIGSLGWDVEEEGVENVTVKSTIFADTQNGFRIKSWARPSNGFVKGIQFIGAIMRNVKNPIVIDQHYCPHNINCPTQVSGIKISDVVYEGIRGTSASPLAIKLDCSSKFPCNSIKLHNVNLTYSNQEAQSFCANVIEKTVGPIQPSGCL